MEVALGPDSQQRLTLGHRGVSILVFVEVALGQKWDSLEVADVYSFNPCFRGSRPRTIVLTTKIQIMASFNPCFRGSRPRTAATGPSFDSFLSFNPCFRGSRPRTFLRKNRGKAEI